MPRMASRLARREQLYLSSSRIQKATGHVVGAGTTVGGARGEPGTTRKTLGYRSVESGAKEIGSASPDKPIAIPGPLFRIEKASGSDLDDLIPSKAEMTPLRRVIRKARRISRCRGVSRARLIFSLCA